MAFLSDALGDERDLISACRQGAEAAHASFYGRFFPPVFRYVLASVGHRQDAEDITAEVFVKAFRSIGDYEDRARPVAAWLFRITRNEVADYYRRRGRRLPAASLDAQHNDHGGRYDPMEASGLVMDLAGTLRTLPPAQRDAVLLRLVGGLSTREAAEAMRVPEGTLRSHLHFGLKALRAAMKG